MNMRLRSNTQRGAVLVVGLIMLTLITVLVAGAFQLSNSSLQSVGNVQTRDEALAAANKALEQVLSSPFTDGPTAESINVDIDYDETTDYVVDIAAPTCVSVAQAPVSTIPPSSVTLKGAMFTSPTPHYQTVWDLDAQVNDDARSGTSVRVRQGVRVLLSQDEVDDVCS